MPLASHSILPVPPGSLADLRAVFILRAEAVGAFVETVPVDALPSFLDAQAAELGGSWSASGDLARSLPGLGRRPLGEDETPRVYVSRGLLGIAATGTVAVAERDPADRRPALLCDRHVLLLPEGALAPDLASAAGRLASWIAVDRLPYITFITGPSRTSDIERVLTIGVHGPPQLTIGLVSGWDDARA